MSHQNIKYSPQKPQKPKIKGHYRHSLQPDPSLRDPKFANPSNLLHLQRWELLEQANTWLPGEGTLITSKNYRYLIGPSIHLGKNGHIHYCYKYPLPSKDNKRTNNKPCVETFAAKIVPNIRAFAQEFVTLKALQNCSNVTKLYETFKSDKTVIAISELAQTDVYNFFIRGGAKRNHGWNLEKPAVREHFCKMVISNIVQGLDQMHNINIKGDGYLHCDLKSANILLYIYATDHSNRKGGMYLKAKLTDFGHSKHGTTRISEKLCSNGMARIGTIGHVAPELLKQGNKYSTKIDIWSLGIVMFSMLVPGHLLFSEYKNLDELTKAYKDLNHRMNPFSSNRPSWWTDFERLSPEARDLILWMTRFNQNERPTLQQILKHPWFLIGKSGYRKDYTPNLKYYDMLCSSSMAHE